MKKVAIIGGGAAGMVAAIVAARNGAKTVLYEKNERIGKKIVATGNGKCNLSNYAMGEDAFFCDQKEFPMEILKQFSLEKTITFFEKIGLCIKEKNGYIYPLSEQATAVLDILRMELERLLVVIETEVEITKIIYDENKKEYAVNRSFYDAIVLACGSKAAIKNETKIYGYELAKGMGHTVIEPLPALVQLRCQEGFFKSISGVRMDASVTLLIDDKVSSFDRGEVQMTDYGISGIPVFQISRFAAKALAKKQKVFVAIDFFPQFETKELVLLLENRFKHNAYKTIEQFFCGMLPKKIIIMLLKECGLNGNKKVLEYKREELLKKVSSWKQFMVSIKGTNPFENAQVCSGGVNVSEITFQMESKIRKGLFFAGEMVDVDAKCGGYNLQWAWSSGYVAGKFAAKE